MNISLEMVNSILGILGSIVGILCSFYPIIKSSPMVKLSDEHIPHTTASSQYSKITSEKVFATGWTIYTLILIVIGGILGPHKFLLYIAIINIAILLLSILKIVVEMLFNLNSNKIKLYVLLVILSIDTVFLFIISSVDRTVIQKYIVMIFGQDNYIGKSTLVIGTAELILDAIMSLITLLLLLLIIKDNKKRRYE